MLAMSYKEGRAAYLIYLGVRLVFVVLQLFPLEWNLHTARVLARCWRWIMPRHYRRAKDHIRGAFGDGMPPQEVDRIARECLECAVMFTIEAVCLPRLINPRSWPRYVQLANLEEMVSVLLSGRGAVLVTGHYGSFELAGHLLACLGFDVIAVMRPLDNKHLNDYIVRSRRTHGLRLLDKRGAAAEAEQSLDDGFLVGFIGDQDAGSKGMFVDFFGRPASTYKSIGLLAMSKEIPIIVGYARRLGHSARYEVGVKRIIRPEEWSTQPDPLRWLTQEYTSAIEAFVRDAPEQYLWIHRRWKSSPRNRTKPGSSSSEPVALG